MPDTIRILLADDHAILRQGTAELLRREPDFDVVGEAADGCQAVALTRELRPDIAIMDIRMPVLSGVEATRQIREALPQVQVLVLTAHDDDQYIFSLLQAGASGYLLKSAPISDLVKAIRLVRAGESPLDPAIARRIVARMAGPNAPPSATPGGAAAAEELTARELEVLQLLARGLSNRAIGEALFISDRTVQAHLTSVFGKLGATSRLDAVLTAIRRGVLALDF
jgi:DNA-binding NarL/FixJ family response regulator